MTDSPLLPEGRTTFDLPMGPIRVRVVDLPTLMAPFVETHYAPFAEPPDPGARVDLTVTCRTGEGLVLPLPEPGGTPTIDLVQESHDRYRIRSHWQDGLLDLTKGTADLLLTDRHEIPLRMSLENFLRVSCQQMLPRRGGFLMHSAGVLDGDRCYLFFGHSGAGKSTSTEFSAPRPALSDDMILVEAGLDRPLAHAVPFFGAFPMQRRVRGAFPIAAACRLRQDDEDRIQDLSVARSAATVSASVPFVEELGLHDPDLSALVEKFCRAVPVVDLHFTRSARFWDVLQARFGAPA